MEKENLNEELERKFDSRIEDITSDIMYLFYKLMTDVKKSEVPYVLNEEEKLIVFRKCLLSAGWEVIDENSIDGWKKGDFGIRFIKSHLPEVNIPETITSEYFIVLREIRKPGEYKDILEYEIYLSRLPSDFNVLHNVLTKQNLLYYGRELNHYFTLEDLHEW